MRAEIIAIGSEILLGQIINSNAQFLSQELALLGIDCLFHTVVGDNPDRIKAAMSIAVERSDIIITTGGLGSTSDDLSLEAIAAFFNEPLVLRQEALQDIKRYFESRQIAMPISNEKQALLPKQALIIKNLAGTAPGMFWEINKKTIISFPGVPKEMKEMWSLEVKPLLLKKSKEKLIYKELKFYGIPEALLGEKVQDLLDLESPTVAPLASGMECKLRIACKSENIEYSKKEIQRIEDIIRQRVGEFIYGENEETLESVVIKHFKEKNLSLSLAESCTGGLISKRLTDIAGSSAVFKLGLVVYSNESKINILGVKAKTLKEKGAVSEECAIEMAQNALIKGQSDYALSVTGIAGPDGGSKEKPVGTIFMALIGKTSNIIKKFNFNEMKRNDIRWRISQEALNWLRRI